MISELYTEDLDINLKYNIYLHCVQNDDVILNINVYDKSLQADLSNYTCRLKAFKSDQIPLIQNTNIDVTGNVVKIEASKQLTTTAGIVKAELQFTDKSTLKKKSTFFIEIKVEKSSLNVDGALSTPMCTLLEEIDNKLDQIENIGQVLDEAKQVRDTLESDIVVGNTTNENIVQSISDADSKKREVEISISNASDKISEVEDSITNADNSRNALDRSKEVANETKIDLDNANVQAEKNIEELNKLGDVTDLAAKVQTNTENISKNNKSIEEVNSHLNENANAIEILNKKDLRTAIHYTDGTLFSTSLNNTHDCWNKWVSVEGNNLENAPHTGVIWGEVFTGGDPARAFQIVISVFESTRKTYIRYLHDSKWSSFQYISTGELKTLTLLNGWTALDKDPTVTKSGNAVILNMRIRNGLFTEGSKIAETGYSVKGGNSIFNIFSMYDGSFNGSVYVDGNGSLICGSNIKSNNDTSINISWVTI